MKPSATKPTPNADAQAALATLKTKQADLEKQIAEVAAQKQAVIQQANAQIAELDKQFNALAVEKLQAKGGVLALESLQETLAAK